ncbi:homoserine dehydrogenase [Alteribacillus bidgolensis]|uniref:Homoserine dehydrogenase n=1 Tax=Alteribacillus bidgolensis TaxID=930129 RepID=A0A1G8EJ54_9BACI|nr:homoserine dehydrogenase [Alteribacillus bidgolensis]SDH69832.1 homoserine dehydrogenase [Alteribacillus bidgolensis]
MEHGVVIGLLGLGTVGSGVIQIVNEHQQELKHQVGCGITIGKVLVRDKDKYRESQIDQDQLTVYAEEVLNDPDIDVVIEVMGGVQQAREYILQALNNKKHVVTANKDLMALYGAELLKVAADNGCDLFYEASVAGGIPVIRGVSEGLSADRITQMMGIVNGTTNYILTKMEQDGRDYEEVLKEAQELGFAESDPTSDVEGLDAARKMAILATLGFSMNVDLEDVIVRGITTVTTEDMEYCKQLGYTLKLIGLAKRTEGRVELTVQPMLLPNSHPLAAVQDEYNAVYVYGEAVGETMFYGPGAGSLPTATAVVSDLVTVVKNLRLGVSGRTIHSPLHIKELKTDEEVDSKYFLRLQVRDETGTFDALTSLFAKEDVSFEKLLQWPLDEEEPVAEVVIITHTTNRAAYERIYKELENMDVVLDVKSSYRVEGGQV